MYTTKYSMKKKGMINMNIYCGISQLNSTYSESIISIALIDENGYEFYGEISDWNSSNTTLSKMYAELKPSLLYSDSDIVSIVSPSNYSIHTKNIRAIVFGSLWHWLLRIYNERSETIQFVSNSPANAFHSFISSLLTFYPVNLKEDESISHNDGVFKRKLGSLTYDVVNLNVQSIDINPSDKIFDKLAAQMIEEYGNLDPANTLCMARLFKKASELLELK